MNDVRVCDECLFCQVADVIVESPLVSEAVVYGVHVPGYEGKAGMALLVPTTAPQEGLALDFDFVTFYWYALCSLASHVYASRCSLWGHN